MRSRLLGKLQFRAEQLLVRGARYRLLFVATTIALISILGGTLVLVTHNEHFSSFREAVWWAFLRLTDPGYLGDDNGFGRRLISTVLTVLGYVVFMGALIAILTQWLTSTIERLELGLSPVELSDHVVVLGWTGRTKSVVASLVRPGRRLQHWLDQHEIERIRVVVLVPRVTPELTHELQTELAELYQDRDIILRSGSPLEIEDLQRVDAFRAGAIVMPGDLYDTDEGFNHDARVLKVLLSMTAFRPAADVPLPRFVAELSDPSRTEAARRAYDGPVELLPSDAMLSRLIAGSSRQPGFADLLLQSMDAPDPVLAVLPPRPGTVANVADELRPSVLLGAIRKTQSHQLILRARPSHARLDSADLPVTIRSTVMRSVGHDSWHRHGSPARVLILGWSAKAPDLIADLAAYPGARPQLIRVVSIVPPAEREADLGSHAVRPLDVTVDHVHGNKASPRVLQDSAPGDFDVVIVLASETRTSQAEADADTIAAHIALQEVLARGEHQPHCIVELTDPDNVRLLRNPATEVVTGGPFLSFCLAQSVLAAAFAGIVRGLLLSNEQELRFEPVGESLGPAAFEALGHELAAAGSVLVGFRRGSEMHFAPQLDASSELGSGDDLVVFRRLGPTSSSEDVDAGREFSSERHGAPAAGSVPS